MRLHSIAVQDVGRFGRFSTPLAGQQIGVIGKNGSGKSTLLSSIYYAVTGDLGRLGKADGVNTARVVPDESPFVRLTFHPTDDTSADPAVVVRKLPADGKDGSRRLAYGDRTWTAQADISDLFERWTGLTPKAMAEFVFVPQGGLDQVVRAAAPRRAEILQRVFGVAHAERAREAARDRLARLPGPADAGVLATLRAAAGEALGAAEAAETAAYGVLLPDPTRETADHDLLAAYAAGEAAHVTYTAAVSALVAVEQAEPKPPTGGRPDPGDTGPAERALLAAKAYQTRVNAAADAAQYAATVRDAAARAVVPPTPGPPPTPPPELLAVRDRKFTLSVVAAAPPGVPGVCPVCAGRLAPDAADSATAAAQLRRLDELEAAFALAASRHKAELARHADAAGVAGGLVRAAADAAAYAQNLRAAVGGPPDITEAEAVAYLAMTRRLEGEWAAYDRTRAAHAVRLAAAADEVKRCPGYTRVFADAAAAARTRVNRGAEARAARAVLDARAAALREAAAAAVETVRQAESRTAAAARIGRWRDRVEEVVRVLQRDAAPAAAVRACLEGLSADLNNRLGHLAAAFRVRVGSDGELYADYRDGTRTRTVPADRVSGGEGAVLGLAWRLALLDRYAPKVGLLCLDEPTTGLDADRVGALKSALEAWRPYGSGRQFVIVTHERKLLPAFDAVVDLDAG